MGKLTAVAFAATGYVLGARAGRERYEQIVDRASKVWKNPKVQKGVSDAEQVAKDKAPGIQQKITEAASKASKKRPKKWSKKESASGQNETSDGDGANSSTGSSNGAPGGRRAAQSPGGE